MRRKLHKGFQKVNPEWINRATGGHSRGHDEEHEQIIQEMEKLIKAGKFEYDEPIIVDQACQRRTGYKRLTAFVRCRVKEIEVFVVPLGRKRLFKM